MITYEDPGYAVCRLGFNPTKIIEKEEKRVA